MDFEAYCVKCRQKRPIKNGTVEKTKTGRHAAKGVCPVCGTKVTRFISSAEAVK
jgi:O-acetyl-ADP-ribose deacetylase (regulator of RNase III)